MNRSIRRLPLVAACLLVAGPALADNTKPAVISEGGVAPYYRLASPAAEPGFPASVPDANESVCVSLGYQIKADGSTSDYSMLRSWSSKHPKGLPDGQAYSIFSRTAVAAVMQRKFVPAEGGSVKPAPIFTATTFAFTPDGSDRETVRGKCQIADLPDFIKQAQADSYRRRGNLNKGRLDRQQMENPARIQGPSGY